MTIKLSKLLQNWLKRKNSDELQIYFPEKFDRQGWKFDRKGWKFDSQGWKFDGQGWKFDRQGWKFPPALELLGFCTLFVIFNIYSYVYGMIYNSHKTLLIIALHFNTFFVTNTISLSRKKHAYTNNG